MSNTAAMTIKDALAAASLQLQQSDSAELDAQLLLARVLDKPRSWLYAWPEQQLSATEQSAYASLLAQREQGRPVAYLLGQREFWNLKLKVGPAVLIPRPETELLVELALQALGRDAAVVADLGTGSGAIALALASERSQWQVYATELSAAALELARENCRLLKLDNLTLLQGSWCEPLPGQCFDLIVSNPPYLAADDEHLTQGDLRFEPRSALVAADAGLQDIRQLAQEAWPRLAGQGLLLVEHGWQQGAAVRSILQTLGYSEVTTHADHGGRERATMGKKP